MATPAVNRYDLEDAYSTIRPSSPKSVEAPIPSGPSQLEGYRLVAPLGKGGMAEVFLAAKTSSDASRAPCVIKRLYPHFGEERTTVQMFLDEARLVIGLHHPNIVKTFEVGMMGGKYCIVMEYLAGQPLQRVIRRNSELGGMPVELAIHIAIRILDALDYAHCATDSTGEPLGIVHRDISPHNVFLTNSGQVKVLDFGIAKAQCHEHRTATGLIKGKFAYIAPEQAQGQAVDGRADLWAVGVVLWEMLIGRRLFKAENDAATLRATLRADVPRIGLLRSGVAPELDRVVMRALQRHPNLRYRQASEMRRDLLGCLKLSGRAPTDLDLAELMRQQFAEDIGNQCRLLEDLMEPASGRAPDSSQREPTLSVNHTTTAAVPVEVSRIDTLMNELTRQKHTMRRAAWFAGSAWVVLMVGVVALVVRRPGDVRRPESPRDGSAQPVTRRNVALSPTFSALDVTAATTKGGASLSQDLALAPRAATRVPAEVPPESHKITAPFIKERPARAPVVKVPSSTEAASTTDAYGFLTLDSSPWAWVNEGGRRLGQTPLVQVKLAAGSHLLSLENPELGLSASYVVTIEAGRSIVKRVGLE